MNPPISVLEPSSGDLQVSASNDGEGDSFSSGNSEKTAQLVGGMKDLSLSNDLRQEAHVPLFNQL